MKIYESGENYLETILILSKQNKFVRSVDIADKMNFSKPSVSRAISVLKNKKLIFVDKTGFIILTKEGEEIAKQIYEKHCFLTDFFKFLGVEEEVAKKDACKVEHAMSQETFEKLKVFFSNLKEKDKI